MATEMANALAPIIEKQQMFSKIGVAKHVKLEGWLTLGAMLGVTPDEEYVNELPDGSFEAKVRLLNSRGLRVGAASAICGAEEQRWGKADRFARRSMAVTRATVKAYRLAFAWIIRLAGYEVTPAEEMPEDKPRTASYGYNPQSKAHQDKLMGFLKEKKVPEHLYDDVGNAMTGKPLEELDAVIAAVSFGGN